MHSGRDMKDSGSAQGCWGSVGFNLPVGGWSVVTGLSDVICTCFVQVCAGPHTTPPLLPGPAQPTASCAMLLPSCGKVKSAKSYAQNYPSRRVITACE